MVKIVKVGQNGESWLKWQVDEIIHNLSQSFTRNQTRYDPCTNKSTENGEIGSKW